MLTLQTGDGSLRLSHWPEGTWLGGDNQTFQRLNYCNVQAPSLSRLLLHSDLPICLFLHFANKLRRSTMCQAHWQVLGLQE